MGKNSVEEQGSPIFLVGAAVGLCALGLLGVITQQVRQARATEAASTAALATATPAQRVTIRPASPVARAAVTTAPPAVRGASATYYAACSAVRAAGVAPLGRADPGYRERLDTDGDGLACEAGQPPRRTVPAVDGGGDPAGGPPRATARPRPSDRPPTPRPTATTRPQPSPTGPPTGG
ncbi:hypothetical protein GCM10010123_27500 [Pilimelia anulata]|uniref:Excalibur calcium-binding domain-containing protein n=1 Tax=Pilimelia anulata TaxID=53371 RepID=A0A8J3FBE8_9ACTN|nr:excalibur calcium-binding domain-containing protein [Pilimelia anulata]GGJ96052.1 hypothetical protein GCM10010123_27500 [Pilimelia anulata]